MLQKESLPRQKFSIFTATAPKHIFTSKQFKGKSFLCVSMAMILENIENAASTLLNSRGIRKMIVYFFTTAVFRAILSC
jgi:hypothetical protein